MWVESGIDDDQTHKQPTIPAEFILILWMLYFTTTVCGYGTSNWSWRHHETQLCTNNDKQIALEAPASASSKLDTKSGQHAHARGQCRPDRVEAAVSLGGSESAPQDRRGTRATFLRRGYSCSAHVHARFLPGTSFRASHILCCLHRLLRVVRPQSLHAALLQPRNFA